MVLCVPDSWSNGNLKLWVFENRGKSEYPERNLSKQGRQPTTNSTPTYGVDVEIWTRATLLVGECSHRCAILAPPQNWTRKRTGKWCQEFLFLINVSASSFKWSSPITEIEKENRRFTCCDYRKSRTTLRKDYITSDEWSFFEPARLCTPPKPLFSLKPRARCHILDERLRCSGTHHCLPPWGKFRSRETSLVRVSEKFDEFELTKYMTEKWAQLQGNTT